MGLRVLRALLPLFAVAALLWLGTGEASAQACGPGRVPLCDQGAAYAEALAKASAAMHSRCTASRATPVGENAYRSETYCDNNYPFTPPVMVWVNVQTSYYGAKCSARAPLGSGVSKMSEAGAICSNGCMYSGGGGIMMMQLGGTGPWYGDKSGATPTGGVCSASDAGEDLTQDDCQQIGDLTQCIQPDGRHCVKSSTGKKFCWTPGEAGTKVSGNEAGTKSPGDAAINAPKTPPPNGGDWQSKGSGTAGVSSGGTTNNYNLTVWQSSYGSQGDGTPDGTGGEGVEGEGGPSASGGGSCDMADFQCSDMSSVECNQLVQLWYLRCKGVDLSGGTTCESPPVCWGNAADCYVSSQIWRLQCEGIGDGDGASDAVGNGATEIVSGEGDGSEEPDMSGLSEGEAEELPGLWVEKSSSDLLDKLADLDDDGFISDRSCPSPGSFSAAGETWQIDFSAFCSVLENVSVLVMALAYWLAFRIITKSHWG